MSFIVESNHIKVTNSAGQTIFDTGTPMPHIVQTINNTISVSFPDTGDVNVNAGFQQFGANAGVAQENPPSSAQNPYASPPRCNVVMDYRYYPPQVQEGVLWIRYYRNKVYASESTQTLTIGTVATGTNPDFILVNATANRTSAGSQKDFGTFVSAIPQGQNMIANGSTVLESSYDSTGTPWLNRIMSVYIDGNLIKVDFKHSNREYLGEYVYFIKRCNELPTVSTVVSYNPDNIASNWTISFKVFVGKFTV